jgi:hypothetical protein
MMRPDRIDHRSGKGLVIIHRCTRCGVARANRLAQDTAQEDDIGAIGDLMRFLRYKIVNNVQMYADLVFQRSG